MAAVAFVLGGSLLPGLGGTPAYSVSEGNAGQIEVQINRFEDVEGLEASLAAYGVKAQITYVPNGGECAPGRYVPIDRPGISLAMGIGLFRITLAPGTIRRGETLVVDASLVRTPHDVEPSGIRESGGFGSWVSAEVTIGPVPPCRPIPGSY